MYKSPSFGTQYDWKQNNIFKGVIPMATLTTKELAALEDQLGQEKNLVKKYQTFAAQCQDAALKAKCTEYANKHQAHFDTLMGCLN